MTRLAVAIPAALILLFLHGVGAMILVWACFTWCSWCAIRVGTRWDQHQ